MSGVFITSPPTSPPCGCDLLRGGAGEVLTNALLIDGSSDFLLVDGTSDKLLQG